MPVQKLHKLGLNKLQIFSERCGKDEQPQRSPFKGQQGKAVFSLPPGGRTGRADSVHPSDPQRRRAVLSCTAGSGQKEVETAAAAEGVLSPRRLHTVLFMHIFYFLLFSNLFLLGIALRRRALVALEPALEGMRQIKAVFAVQPGGEHKVENQAESHTHAGVDHTGNGIADVGIDRLGKQHDKVDDCPRLDGGNGARNNVQIQQAQQPQHQIKFLGDSQRLMIVQPIERDNDQSAKQRADKSVEAELEPLVKMVAHRIHRTDAGKTGIAPFCVHT